MCDECGDPRCNGEVDINVEFGRAMERTDATFTAAAGLAERPDGDEHAHVEFGNAVSAVASVVGLPREQVQAYLVVRAREEARDAFRALMADGAPGAEMAMHAVLLPAFLLGWSLRDEQLKAERAADASEVQE